MNLGSAVPSRSVWGYLTIHCAISNLWDQSDLAGSGGLWSTLRRPAVTSKIAGKNILGSGFSAMAQFHLWLVTAVIQVFKNEPFWHSLVFQAFLHLIKPTSQSKFLSHCGPKDNDTQICTMWPGLPAPAVVLPIPLLNVSFLLYATSLQKPILKSSAHTPHTFLSDLRQTISLHRVSIATFL